MAVVHENWEIYNERSADLEAVSNVNFVLRGIEVRLQLLSMELAKMLEQFDGTNLSSISARKIFKITGFFLTYFL